jgi:hypothetical protein
MSISGSGTSMCKDHKVVFKNSLHVQAWLEVTITKISVAKIRCRVRERRRGLMSELPSPSGSAPNQWDSGHSPILAHPATVNIPYLRFSRPILAHPATVNILYLRFPRPNPSQPTPISLSSVFVSRASIIPSHPTLAPHLSHSHSLRPIRQTVRK